jgi:hypothetical protein
MTTTRQSQHSHFKRGSGMFPCRVCQRNSRNVGDNGDVQLCEQCYELAGLDNVRTDGQLTDSDKQAITSYLGELASRVGTDKANACWPELAHVAQGWVIDETRATAAGILPIDEEAEALRGGDLRTYCVAVETEVDCYLVTVNARRAKHAKRLAAGLVQGAVKGATAHLI